MTIDQLLLTKKNGFLRFCMILLLRFLSKFACFLTEKEKRRIRY